MRLPAFLYLLLSVVVTACNMTTQSSDSASPSNNMGTADEAARKVMESLPELISAANYQSMGFSSPEEVKSAKLGAPIPRRIVSYEKLLTYQPGTPLEQLFTNEEHLLYPIQVGDNVKSTALISRKGEKWQISAVGDAYLASIFAAVSDRSAMQIVSIPGLNMDFVGMRQGDNWTLIPVQDYPELGFAKGRPIQAAEALPVISNYAKEFDKRYGDQIRNRKLVN